MMFSPPDTLRQISSRLTFVAKFISPIVGLIVGVNMALLIGRFPKNGDDIAFQVVVISFIVAIEAYHVWTAYRIKSVKADSRNLYVSNFFKETTIPLAQVDRVTRFLFAEPQIVTIHLSSPSEFGKKIVFMAPYRWFGFNTEHPIVAELQRMAAAAR